MGDTILKPPHNLLVLVRVTARVALARIKRGAKTQAVRDYIAECGLATVRREIDTLEQLR